MTDPSVHYAPATGVLRVYSRGGYRQRSAYAAVVNIVWMSDRIAMLHGAHGKLTRTAIRAAFRELYRHGARELLVFRAKGRKMPYGTLLDTLATDDIYVIDLSTIPGIPT